MECKRRLAGQEQSEAICHLSSVCVVRCNGMQPYNTRRLYRNHLQTMSLCIDKRLSARWWQGQWWWWWWIRQLCHLGIDSGCVCPIGVRVTNRLSSPSNRNKCLSGAVRVGHLIRTGRDTSSYVNMDRGMYSHSLTCIAIIQVAHTFPLLIRVAWMMAKWRRRGILGGVWMALQKTDSTKD